MVTEKEIKNYIENNINILVDYKKSSLRYYFEYGDIEDCLEYIYYDTWYWSDFFGNSNLIYKNNKLIGIGITDLPEEVFYNETGYNFYISNQFPLLDIVMLDDIILGIPIKDIKNYIIEDDCSLFVPNENKLKEYLLDYIEDILYYIEEERLSIEDSILEVINNSYIEGYVPTILTKEINKMLNSIEEVLFN